MSKAEAIDALLESATFCFARRGFDGASLREIASQAGAPLSTIHMYFGSKAELFVAATRRVWQEIDQERSQLFRDARARSGEQLSLADLIYALALPIVQRAMRRSRGDIARISVLRVNVSDRLKDDVRPLSLSARKTIAGWIDEMTRMCPDLDRDEVVWVYSLVISTIYSWQLIDHKYDHLLSGPDERSPEEVVADLVAFGCAGVQAIVKRRGKRSGLAREVDGQSSRSVQPYL